MTNFRVPEGSRWTVVQVIEIRNGARFCIARCECGTEREVRLGNVSGGMSLSCGCIKRPGRPPRAVPDKFWPRVDRGDMSGCWPWLAGINQYGYGILWHGGRNQMAHRIAYELLVGPIPSGLTIDHLCRNRRCVNPAHMEPVTREENSRRGAASRRLERAS